MPSPGASAPGGELGRTPRNRGGKTRGTPATASNPRARTAFKFLASLAARTRISTRPHIRRRARRPHPPCLGIEKKDAPNRAPHAGRTLRRAHLTCNPSHTEPAPRRDPATRGGAEAGQAVLRRTGIGRATRTEPAAYWAGDAQWLRPEGRRPARHERFCGEPGGVRPLPHIVFSATRRGGGIQMAKKIRLPGVLPTPDSRESSRLPRALPDSRACSRLPRPLADSRLARVLPTPAPGTPGTALTLDSRLPPPGLPARPTPSTPDSRECSRLPPPGLPARP